MVTLTDLFPPNWQDCFDARFPKLGVGFDVATTTNKKSNPSSICVTQFCGGIYFARLLLVFKNKEPQIPLEIINHIQRNLPYGLKLGKLCIDATSERFFAADFKKKLQGNLAVELVDSSTTTIFQGEKMNFKAYLGNLLCNAFEDGSIAICECEWLKNALRQVVRNKGTFMSDVDGAGNHADSFDALKLSLHALTSYSNPAHFEDVGIGELSKSLQKIDNFNLEHERNLYT